MPGFGISLRVLLPAYLPLVSELIILYAPFQLGLTLLWFVISVLAFAFPFSPPTPFDTLDEFS
jgi:hypothetical protein